MLGDGRGDDDMTTNQDERAALVARLRDEAKEVDRYDHYDNLGRNALRDAAAQIESDGRKLARIREWSKTRSFVGVNTRAELDAILEVKEKSHG
jgi:hypothetical protein